MTFGEIFLHFSIEILSKFLELFASDNKFPRLSVRRGEPILPLIKEPISKKLIPVPISYRPFCGGRLRPGVQFAPRPIVAHRGTQGQYRASF